MFQIGRDCIIHPTARIDVKHGFLGDRAMVREHAVIEGDRVEIGAEAFINRFASIGGGSSHDPGATLIAGDFLHMGFFSHINTARRVTVGHEFGCGIETKIFTHGVYSATWDGFPARWGEVAIGDRVWLPNAWVNPGVSIGGDVVVAARSLVNKDLPPGCLAGGTPAVVLKLDRYPRVLTPDEKRALFADIFAQALRRDGGTHACDPIDDDSYRVDRDTVFHVTARRVEGRATDFTETLRNQLRRNGIRFRFVAEEGEYRPWRGVLTSA
jgi:acetyltransferase-like isoleucine patch superfamily enzyme